MTSELLFVIALGFFLGVRHATDADHVIAVTTILSRQRGLVSAALTGLLWGIGHTLTIVAVGAVIILFGAAIPPRVSVGMELSVGVMLIVLGAINVASFVKTHPRWFQRQAAAPETHAHGDYVHSHPHGHDAARHPHAPAQTPLAALDRRFQRTRIYAHARPVVVGIVHGLAGSAAVTLMVGAAVRDPQWAVGYLLVFGVGTIAGMLVITVAMASALRAVGSRSEAAARHLGLACGLASIAFGASFAYQIWLSGVQR